MKKIICLLLSLVTVLLIFSSCKIKEESYEFYGMKFEETGYRKLTLTKYSGEDKEVEIPENIKGINVVAIGVQAFENSKVESIIIPSTLEVIEGGAFKNCKNLKEINFGYGVKNIGDWAFFGCDSLGKVNLPNSIEKIGEAAFAQSGISELDFGNGALTVGKQAFYSCDNLRYVDIKSSIAELGEQAFFNCSALSMVYVASEVTNIGQYAIGFRQNSDNQIEVAKHTSICARPETPAEEYAKTNGVSFLITASGEDLDYSIAGNDIRISAYTGTQKSFVIPASINGRTVIGIEAEAFANNLTVQNVVLPETVKEIGEAAFCGCVELEYVYIPETVTYIGGGAFSETLWINSLTDEFVIAGDKILIDYNGSETEVFVPDGVKMISGAFNMNSTVQKVILPDSVTNIGGWSFLMCEKLNSIEIPSSVTVIESKAFSWCKSLESITLGDGVEKIDEKAFFACTLLSEVNFKNALTTIGEGAFDVCPALLSITIPESVTEIADDAFNKKMLNEIHGKKDSYAQKYANKIGVAFVET